MKKLNRISLLLIIMLMLITGCSSNDKDLPPINEGLEQKVETEVEEVEEEEVEEIEEEIELEQSNITDGEMIVSFIDVGQGDAILIEQDGNNMLIDAGENNKGQLVVNYLRERGVEKLDYVVGTHPHSDHIGGLDDIIEAFDVSNVIMPNVVHTTKTFEDVVDAVASKGLKITKPQIGKTYSLGDSMFTIIAPNGPSYSNLNNYSVGIKLEYGNNSFVFTGDAEEMSEREMVNNGIDLKADVLKAGHHGSNTSNIDEFLKKVDPQYVVISAGEGNQYGHPDLDTISKFKNKGIEIFRTDKDGTIVARSDGENISFNKKVTPIGNIVKKEDKPVESENSSQEYIATKSSKILHKASCSHVPQESNRDYFGNKDDALNSGYRACKVCKP